MCHSSAILEKKPPLVSLLWGKWEENGTITNNRSATVHEPLENPALMSFSFETTKEYHTSGFHGNTGTAK